MNTTRTVVGRKAGMKPYGVLIDHPSYPALQKEAIRANEMVQKAEVEAAEIYRSAHHTDKAAALVRADRHLKAAKSTAAEIRNAARTAHARAIGLVIETEQ